MTNGVVNMPFVAWGWKSPRTSGMTQTKAFEPRSSSNSVVAFGAGVGGHRRKEAHRWRSPRLLHPGHDLLDGRVGVELMRLISWICLPLLLRRTTLVPASSVGTW